MFRGWDAFVDAKDVGVGAKDVGTGAGRRVPADTRWFSGSCRSISRNARPAPLVRSVSSTGSRPPSTTNINNIASTSVPASSMRSESNTPTSTNAQLDTNSTSSRTIPTSKNATEAQSGTQPNLPTVKVDASNTEAGSRNDLSETPMDSEKQVGTASNNTDATKEPGGAPDVAVKTEALDQSNVPSTSDGPDAMKESESSTKKGLSVVDVPIPKKKDSKLSSGDTDKEAPAIGASVPKKEGASKKVASSEALKKQDSDTGVQKEGSANKERETTQQEPPKQEDPSKRRLTRKRKSMSESDK